MKNFVFRNATVEPFFEKGTLFSAYGSVVDIGVDIDHYFWFYELSPERAKESLVLEINDYSQQIQFVLDKIPSTSFLYIFLLPDAGVDFLRKDFSLKNAILQFNEFVLNLSERNSQVRILDYPKFLSQYPIEKRYNARFYFSVGTILNPLLEKDFKIWLATELSVFNGVRKKCLILDCDNTLWGGIVGEDGINGIKLGGNYPGNVYVAFQKKILELKKSGVLLALCSKNDAAFVDEVFQKHPEMILKKSDFVVAKVNWENKASNIAEIASELNLNVDSFVFIDDNIRERECVRKCEPNVIVPGFPPEPYLLLDFINEVSEKYFSIGFITEEDKNKTKIYSENIARDHLKNTFANNDDFIKSLDIKIQVSEDFSAGNFERVVQMIQKTNQFNLTTMRYSEAELKQKMMAGSKIYQLFSSDKFGDNGMSGVLLCSLIDSDSGMCDIELFLMSCRVLGRKLECQFLEYVLNVLKSQGVKFVSAKYIPSEKNKLVKDFYEKMGWELVKSDQTGVKLYKKILN